MRKSIKEVLTISDRSMTPRRNRAFSLGNSWLPNHFRQGDRQGAEAPRNDDLKQGSRKKGALTDSLQEYDYDKLFSGASLLHNNDEETGSEQYEAAADDGEDQGAVAAGGGQLSGCIFNGNGNNTGSGFA